MVKKERFKLIPEVYLLLVRDGKILLLQRKNTGYEDGNYSLVAGHAEAGEPLTHAMVREAKEECGIKIKPGDLALSLVMHRKTDRDQAGFFFRPLKWEGDVQNLEPEKCEDLNWFPIDNLPENTIPYIRKAVESLVSGVNYCEFGW
ncbi:MAG: NUDIX hydrolase [Candidatus Yanofskybacteria bacterium RIFCSPHIGHO2_01_FULL_44_17]|uniref:NUDIX hydrolase n=1 Tax=Candidatus Yanofskybacteria bacterium RIFCSPHIGHO2_01_FULL_44_17 TaxID=1802668 RepID=A0A1F8EUC0_9BACT|nr:MAG: NUDIX hydrolase [Candidatus Yanofskybacteria bacterium RIFCSPHIGHO2_01_FULL_44_17]